MRKELIAGLALVLAAGFTTAAAEDEVMQVPYTETFDTQDAFDKFTVLDNNYDYSTWEWDSETKSARYDYDASYNANDWLLTPMIRLNPGQYVISYKATNFVGRYASYDEKLATAYGVGTDPTKYTELLPTTVISHGDTIVEHTINVTEVEDVRIGFHALSDAGQYYLWIDDISVKAVVRDETPDSVTSLTATAADGGTLSATVSFRAPTLTTSQNTLTSLTKIEVLRNDTTLIDSILTPQPGQTYTITDNAPVNGYNKYTVVAYNTAGRGATASASCFVGQDIPLAPANIAVADNFDGTLTLSWDAPQGSTGKNGRYVNNATLKYNVYEVKDQQLTLLAANVESRQYTVTATADGQEFRYYQVSAVTTGGEGDMDMSNAIIIGNAYALPFTESVSDGETSKLWWTERQGYTSFIVSHETTDADGNDGCFSWYPYGDSQAWINSGKISLDGAADPQLVFSYYALAGKANQIKVEIMPDFQRTDTVLTIDMAQLSGADGWRKASIPLSAYNDSHYIVVKFNAISRNAADETMRIDNVRIYDAPAVDLAVRLVAQPKVNANDKATLTAIVTNNGTEAVSGATLSLLKDGEEINRWDDISVAALADTTITYAYQTAMPDASTLTFTAVVAATGDADATNNTSNTATVEVVKPNLRTATDLTATKTGGGVSLQWNAPDFGDGTVTDDFESYEANATGGFGDWTTIDADGARTFSADEFDFPAMGEPFAFLCFNPAASGIDTYSNSEFMPHSGSQFMASFMNDPVNYSDVQNDDWLISPELTGAAQTIDFWAKSMLDGDNGEYKESFEVRYSTTDTARTSFTLLDTHANIDATWTRYTAQLPEGTKYFAIRCISDQKFMFCVDDVTFAQKIPEILAYNVYRGTERIATVDGQTTSYLDAGAADGDTEYYVTVVYAKGESDVSNAAKVTDGIAEVNASRSALPADGPVYTISGIRIADSLNARLPRGIYIVAGRKVVVK